MIPAVAPAFDPRALQGPCVRVLSNGTLTTLVSAEGAGFTDHAGRRATGAAPEAAEPHPGLFLYVRDEDDGALWSVGAAPVRGAPARCEASAEPGVVRLERVERDVEAVCEIALAPDADAELRRVALRNAGDRPRRLSLTSYLEVVLNHPRAHEAHPAFSKLFVQTRADAAGGAIVARRRPRGAEAEAPVLAHALHGPGAASCETDRVRFLGRGRSYASPAALAPGARLSGTAGNVLDPIASWRRELVLAPGEQAEWIAVVALAATAPGAVALARRYAAAGAFAAVRAGAAAHERERLARFGLEPAQGAYLQALAGAMWAGAPYLRCTGDVLRRVGGQPDDLWVLDVPPDLPLAVVEPGPRAQALAAELAAALGYLAALGLQAKGLALDPRVRASGAVVAAKPGVDAHFLDAARACARLVLRDDWPALAAEAAPRAPAAPRARAAAAAGSARPAPRGAGSAEAAREAGAAHPREAASAASSRADGAGATAGAGGPAERLLLPNGRGGFSPDGREYVVRVAAGAADDALPPMPWVNVLATPRFGTLVSERGAATTWSRNSREHRLTPWSNDPALDPHGEALWLRDEDAGLFWSPQPGPTPGGAEYEVRHGHGHSRWLHRSHELEHEVTTVVAPDAPLKLTRVRLVNRSASPRRLSVFSYARLVLGVSPGDPRAVVVEPAGDGRTLCATNGLAGVFGDGVAFASAASDARGARVAFSADRHAFLGPGGDPAAPRAVAEDAALDGRAGAPLDPCFALQLRIELAPGASAACIFALGEAPSAAEAARLAARFVGARPFEDVLRAARAHWEEIADGVRVETPSPALDVLANGWLAYQTVSCRLWGRSAFYQSGGAFGFRDQLQDASALALVRPDLTRAQILLHAAHQFAEGDVLHWWHPPAERGTRTRFSDDLLWLPYVTAHYVATTGDRALLDEEVDFVTARALAPGEDEAYLATTPAGEPASVYEHCCRAIDRSLRVGRHGLPLMGTGDWNDGMNLVGREGRGESVWMAFFLYDVLRRFEPLCEARGDASRARRYAERREALSRAVEEHAWDGGWYRRAYFDDGTPLGTADAEECRIDVLPQAWAVISGAAPRARCETAVDAMLEELVLPEGRLLRLLAPPFDRHEPSPGYIRGYVPGIRENGGQYTHAAIWAVRALAELGRRDRAFALLEMLLAPTHARDAAGVETYKVEPYVVAADVYAVPPHVGRGGWTWYTGSAGWLWRVALESVLGLRLEEGRRLVLRPCVPDDWPGFRIELRLPHGGPRYAIRVRSRAGSSARVVAVRVDGADLPPEDGAAVWPVADDHAAHTVDVELGP